MNKYIKKVARVAAALVLLIGLIVVSNPTSANSIKGLFKDITSWNGTIKAWINTYNLSLFVLKIPFVKFDKLYQ